MVRHAAWALCLLFGCGAAQAQNTAGLAQALHGDSGQRGEGGQEYVVQARDTFVELSERLGVTPDALARVNGQSRVIRAGEWLQLPPLLELPEGPALGELLRRIQRGNQVGLHERGLAGSSLEPWSDRIPSSLARRPDGNELLPGESGTPFAERLEWEPFPRRGSAPEGFAPFTLDFLDPKVTQACVAVGRLGPDGIEARWHGRAPLENVDWGGGAYHLAGLLTVSALNRRAPRLNLAGLRVRGAGESRGREVGALRFLIELAASRDAGRAESLARFLPRRARQAWSVAQTGHAHELQGQFGEPSFAPPVLVGGRSRVVLAGRHDEGSLGANRLSAYDLVRLTAMAAWHPHLTRDQRLAGTRGGGLALVLESMAHDRARYLDLALTELGLLGQIDHVAVVSSSGWDYDRRAGTYRASYVAAVQVDDRRRSPAVQRRFVLALTAEHSSATWLEACMAHEVIQLTRWLFTGELR